MADRVKHPVAFLCSRPALFIQASQLHPAETLSERPFAEAICMMVTRHLRCVIHPAERPFACSKCDQGFDHIHYENTRNYSYRKGHLHALNVTWHLIISIMRMHEAIHSEELSFACSKCDEAFDHIHHDNTRNYSHRREAICML